MQHAAPAPLRPEPSAQSNLRGLILLGLGFLLFNSGDILAKILTDTVHPIQIVWTRQLGLAGAALFFVLPRGMAALKTRHPVLQVLRGAIAVTSALCFVLAIRHVPIADAVAVTFVAPFMVTIMGALFLREKVGPHRWGAVAVGFVGAMIVIRPGMGVFHPAIFFVILAAAMFALRQVLSRALAASDLTATTLAYTALTSIALLTIPLLFVWQTPDSPRTILIMVAMAALAGGAETAVIRAFEIAHATAIAPMHYSLMIWATFYGWAVFGTLPDKWTWTGTAIIFVTGLYLINRERLAAKRARAAEKQAQTAGK